MLPLSEFLSANKPNVINFIDNISNLEELKEAHVIRINDFYEETGDSNQQKQKCTKTEKRGKSSSNDETYLKCETENEEDRLRQMHVQFENASCKYLAILNRLLNSFVPEMKLYLKECQKRSNRSSRSDSSEGESADNIKTNNSGFATELGTEHGVRQSFAESHSSDEESQRNEESNNQNDSEFQLSLEKLINILNRINGK